MEQQSRTKHVTDLTRSHQRMAALNMCANDTIFCTINAKKPWFHRAIQYIRTPIDSWAWLIIVHAEIILRNLMPHHCADVFAHGGEVCLSPICAPFHILYQEISHSRVCVNSFRFACIMLTMWLCSLERTGLCDDSIWSCIWAQLTIRSHYLKPRRENKLWPMLDIVKEYTHNAPANARQSQIILLMDQDVYFVCPVIL